MYQSLITFYSFHRYEYCCFLFKNSIFAPMQFLYPAFLWAMAALAIPIIIHLFYFRRFKKVSFTNVRLLKEIKEETASRNKLKDLLILLSRFLALALLIAAFAQPFIPRGDGPSDTQCLWQ